MRVAALLWFALRLLAQPVTIGVEGGLLLTTYPETQGPVTSKPYLIGPMGEVRCPLGFAFEVDALYSRLGNMYYIPLIANESTVRQIANSWEYPLLFKYRVPVPRVHPFVSIGAAPRTTHGQTDVIHYGYYPSDVTFYSSSWSAFDYAFVLSGGIELLFGHLRIAPEIRYLHWSDSSNPTANQGGSYLQVPGNEAQFLLGIGVRR